MADAKESDLEIEFAKFREKFVGWTAAAGFAWDEDLYQRQKAAFVAWAEAGQQADEGKKRKDLSERIGAVNHQATVRQQAKDEARNLGGPLSDSTSTLTFVSENHRLRILPGRPESIPHVGTELHQHEVPVPIDYARLAHKDVLLRGGNEFFFTERQLKDAGDVYLEDTPGQQGWANGRKLLSVDPSHFHPNFPLLIPQVGFSLPKAIHANVAEPPDDVEGEEMDRAFTAFDPASLSENGEQKEKTHKFLRALSAKHKPHLLCCPCNTDFL
ncbi:unnamed protein product [Amoebophrya sp. A120]|nr:unnamed protein product [Amoebophrya sp. A120]|eukprot:GSA120T00022873001.1